MLLTIHVIRREFACHFTLTLCVRDFGQERGVLGERSVRELAG